MKKRLTAGFTAGMLMLGSMAITAPAFAANGTGNPTNGNGGATDVGTWYTTYNNTSMFASNLGSGIPVLYRPLDRFGNYSIPDSSDPAQADFDLQQLADAKIDFIVLDETNGGMAGYMTGNNWIVDNAGITAARIKVWNASHSWKIKYAFAIGAYDVLRGSDSVGQAIENQAHYIYDNFVNNASYGGSDNYYQIDGEPLLVVYGTGYSNVTDYWINTYSGTKTYGDHFTIRTALNGDAGMYGWDTWGGTQLNPEVEVVSPGWNAHHVPYDGTSYSRSNGDYYANAWNTVFNNPLPRIVMTAAFNDYYEDQALWVTDTSGNNNSYEEKWYGHDGLLHPSMYWDATKRYIDLLRNFVTNPGFETPPQSNYAYGPFTNGWTFDSFAGVQHNGSSFGAVTAPQGTQTAFVQNGGQMTQAVTMTAGTHTINFQAAKRVGTGFGTQTFEVYVDSSLVGTYSPTSASFGSYVTNSFVTTAGAHTIKFKGTTTGDNTAFIDAVSVESYNGNPSGAGLELSVTNDGSATSNRYVYKKFSNDAYTFQSGDVVEYDVKLSGETQRSGGIDIHTTDNNDFRSTSWTDQNGITGHPGGDISQYAANQWYHRQLPVPGAMIGKTSAYWMVAGENDTASLAYGAKYDNIVVKRGGSVVATIYASSGDYNLTGDQASAGVSASSITTPNVP